LTVHVGFDRLGPRASQPTFEYPGVDPAILAKLGPRKLVEWVALPFLGTAPSMSFAQLILSGVFDRFPELKIFFAETRLGWVPFGERLFAGVPADEAFKIAARNMLEYFRLEATPMGRKVLAAA